MALEVVFRYALSAYRLYQRADARSLIRPQGGPRCHQSFKPAFAGRVVINPKVVKHEAQRRGQSRAKPAGAQKPVFKPRACLTFLRLARPDHRLSRVFGAVPKPHPLVSAKKVLQWPAFPKPHSCRLPALMILAPRAHLGFKAAEGGLKTRQTIVVCVIPRWRFDHRPKKKLRLRQHPPTAGQGVRITILRQPPTCIKRLAKYMWSMPSQDRLKAHLTGHGIYGNSSLHQRPRADSPVKQADLGAGVGFAEIPLPIARLCLWVGLNYNPRARIIFLRIVEHFLKSIRIRTPMGHRSIPARLVDHKHISSLGAGRLWVIARIFTELCLFHPGNPGMGALELVGVIQRVARKDLLQPRGGTRVKIDANVINHQPQRWLACAPRMKRAQKRIFDAQKAGTCLCRDSLAPRRIGRTAPNCHAVVGGWLAKFQIITCKV